ASAVISTRVESLTPAPPAPKIYLDYQVTQPVYPRKGNPAPPYPDQLRAANIEAEVDAQFVVDTSGRAEMNTFKVVASPHPLFSDAVRRTLPRMTFAPARVNGAAVLQLVRMPFRFAAGVPAVADSHKAAITTTGPRPTGGEK